MNVVFIPSIQSKHLTDVDSYSDYSLKTWKHYCDRIGAKLFVMNDFQDDVVRNFIVCRMRFHAISGTFTRGYSNKLLVLKFEHS